jgi:hypothetical protein
MICYNYLQQSTLLKWQVFQAQLTLKNQRLRMFCKLAVLCIFTQYWPVKAKI